MLNRLQPELVSTRTSWEARKRRRSGRLTQSSDRLPPRTPPLEAGLLTLPETGETAPPGTAVFHGSRSWGVFGGSWSNAGLRELLREQLDFELKRLGSLAFPLQALPQGALGNRRKFKATFQAPELPLKGSRPCLCLGGALRLSGAPGTP
jgi:hypothetical protein